MSIIDLYTAFMDQATAFTCSELEYLIILLRNDGATDAQCEELRARHAEGDEEGDEHYAA